MAREAPYGLGLLPRRACRRSSPRSIESEGANVESHINTYVRTVNWALRPVGAFLFVFGGILATVGSVHSPRGFDVGLIFGVPFLIVGAGLVLAYDRVYIFHERRRLRVVGGRFPFVKARELPYDESAAVEITAARTRNGVLFGAKFHSDRGAPAVPMLGSGDSTDVKVVADFARDCGIELRLGPGIREYAPDWLRRSLPELSR